MDLQTKVTTHTQQLWCSYSCWAVWEAAHDIWKERGTRSPALVTADGAEAVQPKPILPLSATPAGFATYHCSLPPQSLPCCVWSRAGSCNQPEPSAPFPVHITLIGPQLAWEIPKHLFLQTRSWVSFVLQSGETNSPLNHSLIYSFWLLLPPPSAAV